MVSWPVFMLGQCAMSSKWFRLPWEQGILLPIVQCIYTGSRVMRSSGCGTGRPKVPGGGRAVFCRLKWLAVGHEISRVGLVTVEN